MALALKIAWNYIDFPSFPLNKQQWNGYDRPSSFVLRMNSTFQTFFSSSSSSYSSIGRHKHHFTASSTLATSAYQSAMSKQINKLCTRPESRPQPSTLLASSPITWYIYIKWLFSVGKHIHLFFFFAIFIRKIKVIFLPQILLLFWFHVCYFLGREMLRLGFINPVVTLFLCNIQLRNVIYFLFAFFVYRNQRRLLMPNELCRFGALFHLLIAS